MTDSTTSRTSREILVVTNTPEDVQALRDQLGGEGYRLQQSSDAQHALRRVVDEQPDLVLLDIGAADVEGVEFCRALRSRPETEAIPVIVIARDGEQAPQTVLDIGADGYIERPFHSAELLSRIRTLLRLKELHDKVAQQNTQLLEVNARLDRLNQELMARNRELEQGIQMAHRLQEALLPQQYPRVNNISFSHKYSPSEVIGGDVFQIKGLDDGRAAIFIADVSGHGVRAALVTSIVKTVIDYIDLQDKTAGEALTDFNSRFRSVLGPMTPQIYATGVLIMVDGENRRLHVADAGHPCPLLVSKEHMSAAPLMDMEQTGPALGFVPDPHYPVTEHDLSVGDIVLAFTDGIYEVVSEEFEMYGLDRLQKLVADNAHLIPRDLIQRIVTETDEFMGSTKRPDDVCLIALEVH
ncbi:MAG: fused response regulator/phosphatase [Candidatus Brocadiia bacterium]